MAKLLDFSLLFACSSGFNDFSDNDFGWTMPPGTGPPGY